jgi:hypothetical protein
MSDQSNAGTAIGGMIGYSVAGVPGGIFGGTLGGLVGDAFSRKPTVQNFAANVQNDLAPEIVSLDGHQIYVRITTGHGSATLAAARDAAANLTARFTEKVDRVMAAGAASGEAWQGDAAGLSRSVATRLTNNLALVREQLVANSRALDAELTAFEHIRSQVEPVPETPPGGFLNSVNPFPTDVDTAINDYNAKAAKNVALYEAYFAETAAARGQVPQTFGTTAPLPETAAPTMSGASAGPVSTTTTAPAPGGSAGGTAPSAATTADTASGGTPSVPPTAGATSGQGGAGTEPAGRQAPALTTPTAATPGGAPVLPVTPGASAGNTSTNTRPRSSGPSGTPRAFAGAGPAFGPVGGNAAGARGFGGGGSGGGSGGGAGGGGVGSRGLGSGVGGGTGAGPGTGARGGPAVGTGPIPGQNSPTQAPVRGGAAGPAVRGGIGPGGLPMGGPLGRGAGEDDDEHHRKYRIEPDGEELFGTDEWCAPAVIGA